jgi:hypothetical protein
LIDKKKNQAQYVTKLTVDKLGYSTDRMFLKTQNNGVIYFVYNALDLKEQIEETLENKNASPSIRGQLMELDKEVDINDNPVLLVGKIKK